MHRHRFGTKLEGGPVRMTRWQDDTSHDNSSHHGQNSSRFLEVGLKNKLILQTLLRTVMMVCPSHWDTVTRTFFNYPKKWIILYLPDISHLVPLAHGAHKCPVTIMGRRGPWQWCQPWPLPDMAIRSSFLRNCYSDIQRFSSHYFVNIRMVFPFWVFIELHIMSLICFALGDGGSWWYSNDHSSAFGEKCCQFWSIMDHFWAI